MVDSSDFYIVTVDTGAKAYPWRWDIRRHSEPLGIKLGAAGYKLEHVARHAGQQALNQLLDQIAKEERRSRS